MSKTSKYKVGDKVRVRKDLKDHRRYTMEHSDKGYIAVGGMIDFSGKVVTIKEANSYGYLINEYTCTWTDGMFEGLASECEEVSEGKIIIYREGKDVIAKNTETGETAKATCHPDDAFDFNIGAKLAFERLTTPKLLEAFESGKRYVFRKELCKKFFETERPFRRTGFDFITEMWATELDGKEVEVKHTTLAIKDGYHIAPQWCEELKEAPKKEEPKLYNGKVFCVDLNGVNHGLYTVGKIYEFKDGMLTADSGDKYPLYQPVHSFEEWSEWTASKFIEVVE